MDPESSSLSRGYMLVKDPTPTESHSPQRVEGDLVGLGQKKVRISEIIDEIQKTATSFLEFSLQWEEIDKALTMEVDLKEKSVMERLRKVEEKEKSVMERLREVEEKEKKIELFEREIKAKLEDKEKEVELLSKLTDEKVCEFNRKVEQFDVKQRVSIERRKKEAEAVETSRKQLETREMELKEKEEIFKAKAKEIETKEKELEEKAKELDLKQKKRELVEGLIQAETSKRSRLKLLGSEAENSLIRCSKSHEDKEKESSSEAIVVPNGGNIEEEDVATEPKQITCIESEFHDFKKTINSFKEGQLWALYDHVDDMPRLYGRIKRVTKSRSCIQVTWVNPKDEEETVPTACGRFEYGIAETKDHLTFSHEMHRNIRGKGPSIRVYPRKGETWAMFRDWSKSWNNNPQLHKPPYNYDFVEILLEFDEDEGVGGVFLEKVDGFVSVFKHAGQQELLSFIIPPGEINRFSHRVPSFRLSGEEKKGVPVGSFELDPAALPSSILS